MKVCLQLRALNDKIGQGGRITAMYYREAVCSTRSCTCFWQMLQFTSKIFPPRLFLVLIQRKSHRPGFVSRILTRSHYLHVLQYQQEGRVRPQSIPVLVVHVPEVNPVLIITRDSLRQTQGNVRIRLLNSTFPSS